MNETASVAASVHAQPPMKKARRFSFDMAAGWALALTVAIAAIFYAQSASVPLGYMKVAILAVGTLIGLVLYILARLTRGNVIVPPLPLLGALWLVPLAYGLSTLF